MSTHLPSQDLTSRGEPLWDALEVARRLGIHRTRLYHLVRQGRIPHLRVGRLVRFDPKAIRIWEARGGWPSPNIRRRREDAPSQAPSAEGAR
jgi:excisionase family DNA binding protein